MNNKEKICPECENTAASKADDLNKSTFHQESFEDFCATKFPDIVKQKEYAGIAINEKVGKARKLIELHPQCPEVLSQLFDKWTSFGA